MNELLRKGVETSISFVKTVKHPNEMTNIEKEKGVRI